MISSLKGIIRSGLKLFELIVFPSRCQICGNLLEQSGERVVCRNCLEGLEAKNESFCLSCGRFFQNPGQPHLCASCIKQKPPFSLHRSGGRYGGKLKDIIHLFKYKGYEVLGKDLASFVLKNLGSSEEIWWGIDALIPVPLHPKRERERGFNQASVLARELAKKRGIEIKKNHLVRTGYRPPQTLVLADEREKNIKGVFDAKNGHEINGKKFLLVDDVFTTGATLKECCVTLLEAGADEVRAVTVAQA